MCFPAHLQATKGGSQFNSTEVVGSCSSDSRVPSNARVRSAKTQTHTKAHTSDTGGTHFALVRPNPPFFNTVCLGVLFFDVSHPQCAWIGLERSHDACMELCSCHHNRKTSVAAVGTPERGAGKVALSPQTV